jgi:hypothetical protein
MSWWSLINLLGAALFLALDLPKPAPPRADAPAGRTRLELLKDPKIAVAIICGMVSYALMNLMMTSTPLAMVGCGLHHRHGGRCGLGPCHRDVRAVVFHRPPDRALRGDADRRHRPCPAGAGGRRGADGGGALPVLRRARASRHRLELRLHRRHGAADPEPMRPRNVAAFRA